MRTILKMALLCPVICPVMALAQTSGTPLSNSVPQLSSRPGAAYTMYINPAGFIYTGEWFGSFPGTNLGYNNRAPSETFNATEQTAIRVIWAAYANKYASFNVNVTTIDPAIAAGQASTDLQRQNYYDSQAGMMHTVIGPPGADSIPPQLAGRERRPRGPRHFCRLSSR